MSQQKLMKTTDILVDVNVRKFYDPVAMAELTASVKAHGILQPLLVMLTGLLLAGHRRLKAAIAVGLESVPVIITDDLLSDSQIKVIQLTENMQRADLTAFDKWTGCYELMCMNPSWAMKDLAEHLHLDPSMVTRLLSPSKCTPAWQAALQAGKVGISDCYCASKLPESEQAGLLVLKLSGASRDDIEQAGRKTRNGVQGNAGGKTPVKASSVKCLLPSGYKVTVSGGATGLSLDDAAEALGETIKEMKCARDMGYTAKTFAAAMADKAKKGG